jgi:hypothetical protein
MQITGKGRKTAEKDSELCVQSPRSERCRSQCRSSVRDTTLRMRISCPAAGTGIRAAVRVEIVDIEL